MTDLIGKLAFVTLLGLGLAALEQYRPEVVADPAGFAALAASAILLAGLLFGEARPKIADLPPERRRVAAAGLAVWSCVILVLGVAFAHRDSLHQGAVRALSALQPGQPVALSDSETVLTRTVSGHFIAVAEIHGARVNMLVDTGATDVALPYEEAERIGLDVETLDFNRPVMTANGEASVAAVLIEELKIGSIRMTKVRASVAEPGRLSGALLGMSFLGRLEEFSFRGDQLVLRQ